jgi:hypothetical protein
VTSFGELGRGNLESFALIFGLSLWAVGKFYILILVLLDMIGVAGNVRDGGRDIGSDVTGVSVNIFEGKDLIPVYGLFPSILRCMNGIARMAGGGVPLTLKSFMEPSLRAVELVGVLSYNIGLSYVGSVLYYSMTS